MNCCKHVLLMAILFCALAVGANAQWTVAFQDQSKRDLNVIFFLDSRFGWIVGDRGIIHATQDGGRDWTPQSPRVNANINDIFFRTREEGWLITGGARIFRTEDGGESWLPSYQLSLSPGRDKKTGKIDYNSKISLPW